GTASTDRRPAETDQSTAGTPRRATAPDSGFQTFVVCGPPWRRYLPVISSSGLRGSKFRERIFQMNMRKRARMLLVSILFPVALLGQMQRDAIPVKTWSAPLYWQPTEDETRVATAGKPDAIPTVIDATTPANSLVFVGMTPCRIADTRSNSGFNGF